MRDIQENIIQEMGVVATINPAQEVERRVQFLVDYAMATGAAGFVLGISGGVDSSLAGRLAQLAAHQLRDQGQPGVFVAVRLPHKVQQDESDAQKALAFVQADEVITFNIGPAVDGFTQSFTAATGTPITDYNKGNVKARMRMVAQYALAGERKLLVIGTDHGAESVTGFFTKFGDGGADVLPLYGLNKRQIRTITEYLGAPETVWQKTPTADLLEERPGQSDETELGISYDHIDDYLEGKDIPEEAAQTIEARWATSRHKRTTPVTLLDSWWKTNPTA